MASTLRNYLGELPDGYDVNLVAAAEAMVDARSTPFLKAVENTIVGYSSTGSATSLTLSETVRAMLPYEKQLVGCLISLEDGDGKTRDDVLITGYDAGNGIISFETDDVSIDYGSITFIIRQVGLYPRLVDTQIV